MTCRRLLPRAHRSSRMYAGRLASPTGRSGRSVSTGSCLLGTRSAPMETSKNVRSGRPTPKNIRKFSERRAALLPRYQDIGGGAVRQGRRGYGSGRRQTRTFGRPHDHQTSEPPTPMTRLPPALSIAIWYVAAIWLVGLMALLSGASADVVLVAAIVGAGSGIVEWLSRRNG
jgi:hypothetical protein